MTVRARLGTRIDGLSANMLGALFMVIGSLGYVVNDALIRLATNEGLNVYQALCIRGIVMALVFAAMARRQGARVSLDLVSRPLVGRVVAELAASALFFTALVRIDFANAQTILLVVPFAVTFFASRVLGETVTGPQYVAILAGFVGVLLVVQPATDGFSIWSLVVVASAGFMVVREFATQKVSHAIPASVVALITALGLAALTGVLGVFAGRGGVTVHGLLLVLCASVCLIFGYIFTIQTVRVGALSVSAPFRYTTLIAGVALGYVLFNETPNGLTLAGCALILVAGVYATRFDSPAT